MKRKQINEMLLEEIKGLEPVQFFEVVNIFYNLSNAFNYPKHLEECKEARPELETALKRELETEDEYIYIFELLPKLAKNLKTVEDIPKILLGG